MSGSTSSVESQLRSLVKGVSYRLVGSLATVLVSFALTGSARIATLIGSGEIVAKVLLFWGHERLWQRIRWGREHASIEALPRPDRQSAGHRA